MHTGGCRVPRPATRVESPMKQPPRDTRRSHSGQRGATVLPALTRVTGPIVPHITRSDVFY